MTAKKKEKKPILLVVLYGNDDDIYKSVRKAGYEDNYIVDDSMLGRSYGEVFNCSLAKCAELGLPYFIIVNISIKSVKNWSDIPFSFKGVSNLSYLTDSDDHYFTIFNFKHSRKFGHCNYSFKSDAIKWMREKSISEGMMFGYMSDIHFDYIEVIDYKDVTKKSKKNKSQDEDEKKESEEEISGNQDDQDRKQNDTFRSEGDTEYKGDRKSDIETDTETGTNQQQ